MPMKLSYVPDICPVPGAHEYVVLVSLQFVALVEAGCSLVNGRVILMILACMLCGNADLPGVVLKDIVWSYICRLLGIALLMQRGRMYAGSEC